TFIDNRADSADYGFWLGYSSGTVVRGNSIIGTRTAGIAIEHGSDNTLAGNVIIGGGTGIRLFAPTAGADASRHYSVDDHVLARLERGLVLGRTGRVGLRGNLFDGTRTGLVADSAARSAMVKGNIFLRASGLFIEALSLDAGGNYWGTPDAAAAQARVAGGVTVEPWHPARDAGY